MWNEFTYFLRVSTGFTEPGTRALTIAEMAGRAAFGFVLLLVLVPLGRRRLMSRIGPFDLIVTMIVGSTVSRGITGNAPLLATIAASAAVVALYWLIATLSAYSDAFSRFVEGRPVELLRDGSPDRDRMRHQAISEQDLREALRTEGKKTDLSKVKLATLERSGNISMVTESSSSSPSSSSVPGGGSDPPRHDPDAVPVGPSHAKETRP